MMGILGFFSGNENDNKNKIELENSNKTLYLQNQQLRNDIQNLTNNNNKIKQQYKILHKEVNDFCQNILDREFAKSQIGGFSEIANLDMLSLLKKTEEIYKNKQYEQRQLIISLNETLKNMERENSNLKIQIQQMISNKEQLQGNNNSMINNNNTNNNNNSFNSINSNNINNINTINSNGINTNTTNNNVYIPNETIISFDAPIPTSSSNIKNDDDFVVIEMDTKPFEEDKNFKNKDNSRQNNKNFVKKDNKNINKKDTNRNNKQNINRNRNRDTNNNYHNKKTEENDDSKTHEELNTEYKNNLNHQNDVNKSSYINNENIISEKEINYKKNNQVSNIITKEDKTEILKKINPEEMAIHMIDLNFYSENMTQEMWNIMITIGVDGLSVAKEISETICKRIDTKKSTIDSALKRLKSMGIIEDEKITTGNKWFYVYNLSDLGKRLFIKKFEKKPVLCEKELLIKDHATATHGYTIKNVAEILKDKFGYKTVTIDRNLNSIKLKNGKTYIPDIIVKNDDEVKYYEVELGHHTQKDFNEKCEKMLCVTNEIIFITPSSKVLTSKIQPQLARWIKSRGGVDSFKGLEISIYITTSTQLSKLKWEVTYDIK